MTDEDNSIFGAESILNGLNISKHHDWLIFEERLKRLLSIGRLRPIPPIRGKPSCGDNWYLEEETKNIYFYREPDERGNPEWKLVDPFAPAEPEPPSRSVLDLELSRLAVGRMSRSEALSLLTQLFILIGHGKIETVDRPFPAAPGEPTETWFRNPRTSIVYKLVEGDGEDDSYWGPVPSRELQMKAQ